MVDAEQTPYGGRVMNEALLTTTASLLRWVHLLAGGAWLGGVVMVVFVLVPATVGMQEPDRGRFMAAVFPRVFRVASVLSLTVVGAGIALYLERFAWEVRLSPLFNGRWGWSIFAGSMLALLLTTFHFFAEGRLAPPVRGAGTSPVHPRVITILRIAPRVGLTILVSVTVLMVYAVRGL